MCIHVHRCRPHTGHIYTFMCWCPQQARNIPGGRGNQRAPLRTAMGSSPATISSDQGPIPRPVLARPCALHASGMGGAAPLRRPWALHAQRLHGDPILSPVRADLVRWLCAQESRAFAAAPQNLFMTLIVCACMCMYLHVSEVPKSLHICVCMCIHVYVLYVSYVCACIVCIICISPGKR